MDEIVFLKDKDWSVIDAELCRVKGFTPLLASVENGEVRAFDRTTPYASIDFECERLPHDATGFIAHRLDFLHLWEAFNERGVADNEEALFFWTKKNLRRSARLMSKFMPKMWVLIYPRGAYELFVDPNSKPELSDRERFEAMTPLAEWKPDAME